MAEPTFADVLAAMTRAMATNVRDWGSDRMDAFLWGVLLGWDCDEEHDHDEHCSSAMEEIAARHGWDAEQVERVRSFHRVVMILGEPDPEPCRAETWSWEHFNAEQTDGYWIRCTEFGGHDRHKDGHTGLSWSDQAGTDSGSEPSGGAS